MSANISAGEKLDWTYQVGGLITALFLLTAAIMAPFVMFGQFLEEYYRPLMNGGPVVRVSYGHFGIPAIIWTGVGFAVIAVYVIYTQHRAVSENVRRTAGKWINRWAVTAFVLTIPVTIVGGWSAEQYVRAFDEYENCDRLFELGVVRYEPVYVKDPRLCVSPYALDDALARYGYVQPDE